MSRFFAWVAAAVFLASVVSGCLSDAGDLEAQGTAKKISGGRVFNTEPATGFDNTTLTKPVFAMLPKTRHYIQAAIDDIQLYSEVFLPEGPGPWPAILINSPYYDHGTMGALDVEASFRTYFVPRGYAVVVADVRGTGYSEGCMDMMGAKEQRDTYDLVEWIANQTWSDGKVGMYGVSYVGTTPHEALIMAPPHLVTVVTVAGVTHQWRNMYQNGVPYSNRFYPLTYELLEGAPPPGDAERGPDFVLNAAAGACDQEEMIEHVTPPTYGRGIYDDYWTERNFTLKVENIKASIFYNQGFTDRAVNPMEAIYWYNEIPTPKKAFFGQWPHRTPNRTDWQETLNGWFDHWLKGIPNGIMDTPPVEVITNDERIRVDDEWPPSDARNHRLYLSSGKLSETAPAAKGSDTYFADTANRGAEGMFDAVRPTQLRYESEPLAEELYMSGLTWANLRASSDARNTYFLLSLYDIDAAGNWREVSEGWMNAHLWKDFAQSNPLTPGQEYTFRFKFEPRDYVFAAGHQVGIAVKGHDSRVFPFDEPATTNTIVYDAVEGSYIELPVLDDPQLHELPDSVRVRPAPNPVR
ncbi:MAG TPA: CocE/NonD family hydrolase [Candidatus Thermoplasmatota archaeon]